jgi:CBS domain-containing protein
MSEMTSGGALPVTAFVADTVARIGPTANLYEIADALSAAEISALVVGNGDDAVAVVTERDLVHALAARSDPATTTAGDIGHSSLIWCDVEATVAEVALKMMDEYVRHILVEDDGRLVGIVSARDLLGAYATSDLELVDDPW